MNYSLEIDVLRAYRGTTRIKASDSLIGISWFILESLFSLGWLLIVTNHAARKGNMPRLPRLPRLLVRMRGGSSKESRGQFT